MLGWLFRAPFHLFGLARGNPLPWQRQRLPRELRQRGHRHEPNWHAAQEADHNLGTATRELQQ
eukprot:830145-Lingulodinium_polyedra.AAC.1